METASETRSHGGMQGVYTHASRETGCGMTFAVFVPNHAPGARLPVLWYLSGLTCTHANVMEKGEYRAACAEHGIILVAPDTSPRGDDVPDVGEEYDFGKGAGFYLDAAREPWVKHYRMRSYLEAELPELLAENFPADMARQSITGHSMGGHGALTLAMGLPGRYASVSAFAPIAHPTSADWGRKQLGAYLGEDEAAWAAHDSTLLMRAQGFGGPVLIDQGLSDQFIDTLKPEALAGAMATRRQPGTLRLQKGYDHSYFFVASFMEDHVAFHAEALGA
jgi:S-formylglutathione hydrolase